MSIMTLKKGFKTSKNITTITLGLWLPYSVSIYLFFYLFNASNSKFYLQNVPREERRSARLRHQCFSFCLSFSTFLSVNRNIQTPAFQLIHFLILWIQWQCINLGEYCIYFVGISKISEEIKPFDSKFVSYFAGSRDKSRDSRYD